MRVGERKGERGQVKEKKSNIFSEKDGYKCKFEKQSFFKCFLIFGVLKEVE